MEPATPLSSPSKASDPPAIPKKKREVSKHRILPLGKRFKNKMQLLRKQIDRDTALLNKMLQDHEKALKEKRDAADALKPDEEAPNVPQ